jgi:nucleosome binding factor SPN SPT16 subunit
MSRDQYKIQTRSVEICLEINVKYKQEQWKYVYIPIQNTNKKCENMSRAQHKIQTRSVEISLEINIKYNNNCRNMSRDQCKIQTRSVKICREINIKYKQKLWKCVLIPI